MGIPAAAADKALYNNQIKQALNLPAALRKAQQLILTLHISSVQTADLI